MDTVIYQNDHSKLWLDFSNDNDNKINIEINDGFLLAFIFKDRIYLNSTFSKYFMERIIINDFENIQTDIENYVQDKLHIHQDKIKKSITLKQLSSGYNFLSENMYIRLIELNEAPKNENLSAFTIKEINDNILDEIDDPLTLVALQQVINYYEKEKRN